MLRGSHRQGICCGLSVACALLLTCSSFRSDSESELMEREAVEFISSMPPDLQLHQEHAIRKAIEGDNSALETVRASRNLEYRLPKNVDTINVDKRYRIYIPAHKPDRPLPLLIYLHGGGWCFGSINSCARFCAGLVAESDIAVMAVEYPLAPEHAYPASIDSCTDAVIFAFDNAERYSFDTDNISLGGDSSGGNLALTTALKLVYMSENSGNPDGTLSLPHLKSLLLFYPVVKAWSDDSESWRKYGCGFGLDAGIIETFNEAYVGENNPKEPLISPVCASERHLAQLPPVLIVNADHDILRDQGLEMYKRMADAGVNVTRTVYPGTTHLFITVNGQPAAFDKAIKASAEFLK